MSKINTKLEDLEKEVLRPFTHIRRAKSNHIVFGNVADAMNYWLNIPTEKVEEIKKITENFIDSCYLFDDIQDNGVMRRKIPTSNTLFGVPLALNASIHGLFLVMKSIIDLGHPEAIKIAVNLTIDIMLGQGADIYWRENLIYASEDDYKRMAEKKTSATFLIPVKLMQLFSDDRRDFTKLINLIGVYYEIRDDYCNLVKQEGVEGNSQNEDLQVVHGYNFCEDFTDGKLSLAILHASRTSSEAVIFNYVLKQRTRDYQVKKHCLSLLKELGSLDYMLKVLRDINREMREEVARLGGNPLFEAILDDFYV